MANYQKPKGTQDFFGPRSLKLSYIEKTAREIIKKFGYEEMVTPIFENTEVFIKNVGEGSDIVTKEMYTFKDKSDRSLTLRPEGTAAIARSFIENKIYANGMPHNKLFYYGPMFRYERQQTGRYREFRQFGVEVYGQSTPLLDAEVISTAYMLFNKFGLNDIKLKINSIGDIESRKNYGNKLQDYFGRYIDNMCDDCRRRLGTNPMRILDCKTDKDLIINNVKIMDNVPLINDYLSNESREYFDEVINILDKLKINYEIDFNLVRGLDYYNDVVFEFIITNTSDELNGMALGGGGKYNGMINSMCGIDIPAIGYAIGMERLIAVMDEKQCFNNIIDNTDVVIIGLDFDSKLAGLMLANILRANDITVDMEYSSYTMKNQFKLCDKLNPHFIIIIGENERKTGNYQIKNTLTKKQEEVKISEILDYIKKGML